MTTMQSVILLLFFILFRDGHTLSDDRSSGLFVEDETSVEFASVVRAFSFGDLLSFTGAQDLSTASATLLELSLRHGVQVFCYVSHMVVVVQRTKLLRFEINLHEQVSLNQSGNPACTALLRSSNLTHFILSSTYSGCETSEVIVDEFAVYRNKLLLLKTPSGSSRGPEAWSSMEFQCTQPKVSSATVNLSQKQQLMTNPKTAVGEANISPSGQFLMQLFENRNFQNGALKFPKDLFPGQRLYVQIAHLHSITADQSKLRPFPVRCSLSKASAAGLHSNVSDARLIISSGCPSDPSVLMFHSRSDNAAFARFSFEVTERLSSVNESDSSLFLHCRINSCAISTSENSKATTTIPSCPSSRACSEQSDASLEPTDALEPGIEYLSLGPLIFKGFITSDEEVQAIEDNNKSETICRPCALNDEDRRNSLARHQVIVATGLSTTTAMVIAFASFSIGVLLMSAVWHVHRQTKPWAIRNNDNSRCSAVDAPYFRTLMDVSKASKAYSNNNNSSDLQNESAAASLVSSSF